METDSLLKRINADYFISTFTKQQIFFIVVIFISIFGVLTWAFRFENTTTGFIILFLFALFAAYMYLSYTTNFLNDNNKLLAYKLNYIQSLVYDHITYKFIIFKNQANNGLNQSNILQNLDFEKMYKESYLDALYLDSDLIEFLYLNKYLYDKNQESFVYFILSTNSFMRVLKELKDTNHSLPNNTQSLIQVALDKYSNSIEFLKSFIFNIESGSMSMKRLNDIVNNYIELMYFNVLQLENFNKLFIKQNGINNSTIMNLFPITGVSPINAKLPNKDLPLTIDTY